MWTGCCPFCPICYVRKGADIPLPIIPIIILTVLLVLFLIAGVHSMHCALRAKKYEGRVNGVIVEVQHFGSPYAKSRNHNYQPVFLVEVDGTEYRLPFGVTTTHKEQYKKGDVMPLCYDIEDPRHFAPEGDTSMMMSALPFFGGVVLCIFLLVLCLT